VSGQVIEAGTARPVAGAEVTLSGYGFPQLQAAADEHGQFVIEGSPAGSFELLAHASGYRGGEYGRRNPSGSWQWFDLRAGESVAAVVLRLWKLASISGAVWNASNEAERDVTVQALSAVRTDGYVRFVPIGQPAVTNARGEFVLTALMTGDIIVAASSGRRGASLDRGASAQAGTVYFPSAATPSEATVLRVGPGEERHGIIVRRPTVVGHLVSGRLTGPQSGVGLPIQITPTDAAGRMAPLSMLATISTTDGAFTFRNVPRGQYTLTAVVIPRPDFAAGQLSLTQEVTATGQAFAFPARGRGDPIAPPPETPTYWVGVPVVVGDSDVTDLAAPIREGARIYGTVEFDADSVPTPDQIRQTPVVVVDSSRPDLGSFPTGAISTDGHFRMVGLPPGRYAIRVLPLFESGLRGWSMASLRQGGREVAGSSLDVGNADVGDVVITLTTRPTTLSGVVRDQTGRPAPEAMLYLFPADSSRWGPLDMIEHWPRILRPARSGAYQAESLAPGEYVVSALDSSAPDPPRTAVELTRILQAGLPVAVTPHEAHRLDLIVHEWQRSVEAVLRRPAFSASWFFADSLDDRRGSEDTPTSRAPRR
jgi:hypothetical protein